MEECGCTERALPVGPQLVALASRLGEGEERAFSVGSQPAAFACRLGGRHDHSVRTEAPAGALGLNVVEGAEASIPGVRIWGPVPKALAIEAGALEPPGM